MRLCGKRLFTRECKAPRPRIGAEQGGLETRAVRRLPGRFFCFEEIFLWFGGGAFFQGVFAKKGVLVW